MVVIKPTKATSNEDFNSSSNGEFIGINITESIDENKNIRNKITNINKDNNK